jgi:hypothetical protein
MTREILNFPPLTLNLTPSNRLHFHLASDPRGNAYDVSILAPASMSDLLDLADKFQDAAIALRAVVAEADPGRAFETNQAIQFGAQRLEGDL